MTEVDAYIELVKQAQQGEAVSANRLAEVVVERLYSYVYRSTLDVELAKDIVQESLLEMVKLLGKLEKADRFWPWLCGIAYNKIRNHRRREKLRKTASLSRAGEGCGSGEGGVKGKEGLAHLVGQELKEIVFASMAELQPRYRDVLSLRCYEEMEYGQIAEVMGCSEFGARVLFSRAKRALAKRLCRRGLGKGALLLGLGLFGKLTAASEAAAAKVSVTTATLKVGTAAGLAGMLSGKAAVVSLSAAGVLAVGGMVATLEPVETAKVQRESLQESRPELVTTQESSKNSQELWYYFPEGAEGAVMMRLVRWDPQAGRSYCQWLQNDRANYYFDKSRDTVYINNQRMRRGDLSVRRLPTDKADLTEFLSRFEGEAREMEYVPYRGRGLLVIARGDGGGNGDSWQVACHYNVLEEEYFQYDWPTGAKIVDNRDAMHQRGWTYFRVDGRIDGQSVWGGGRIPFVYAKSKLFWPWLRLYLGGREIVDGSFAGLMRPWMGLHTIDTVRRDTAKRKIAFETRLFDERNKALVTLTTGQGKIVYTIDMQRDLIEKIELTGQRQGQLTFTYLQDVSEISGHFAEPRGSYGTRSVLEILEVD